MARIRQLAGTDRDGTNVLGIAEAAQRMGLLAKGVKGPLESLDKIPLPAMAHVELPDGLHHYVVIAKVTKRSVSIMDPMDGKIHRKPIVDFGKVWHGVLILFQPDDGFRPGNHRVSALSRFWQLIRPHRSVLLQTLFGAICYTLLGLSTSIFVQKIVDFVLIDGNRGLLNLMGFVMVALLLLQTVIGIFKATYTLKTGQAIDARLILGYYTHLLRLPQQFFDTMRIGEITSRMDDAVKIRALINDASVGLLVNGLVVLFSFTLLFAWSWKLALIMLLAVPCYAAVYIAANRLNRSVQRRLMEDGADLEAQLVESLNAMGTIKQFGLEGHANDKTDARFTRLLRTVFRSGKNSMFASTASGFVSQLFTIILLWVGAGYVLDRHVTPGELLSCYALIGYFTGPVSSLIGMNRIIQDALIAADRLFEILDLECEKQVPTLDLPVGWAGDIRLEGVHFRYGTRFPVFGGLDLIIPAGQLTAIVGESGSGKSTILSLIQNLYPLQQGNIYIGRYAIRYIGHESLRRLVAVVPQRIDLFSGNVVDNIAVGDGEPNMQRILDCCELLGMLTFIESLPDGFATELGENGSLLSGGQRQRIAIARALYVEPEILVLDEATSSLDPEAEQGVLRAIDHLLAQGKTVVVIAHRLSTVRHADKIVVLQNGRLVEEGNHVALLESKGHYHRLWQQFTTVT